MVTCQLCKERFRTITNTHLNSAHQLKLRDYIESFGSKDCAFPVSPHLLPKHHPISKKWREGLKKRPPPWSKGYTKETHPSVAKISNTFKAKKIDNFAAWRERMKEEGKIPSSYPPFTHSGDLAELIGVILGDGHIEKFPRTESLTIASNSNNYGFIKRYASFVENLFKKKPYIARSQRLKNCIRIRIYQKQISKRLEIPHGNRRYIENNIPGWILERREFLIRYLRGLYEAEGSFCVHKPTYTYKLLFANRNESLLNNAYQGLKVLGFHPHKSEYKIQLSRKNEVYRCKDLIKFRQY